MVRWGIKRFNYMVPTGLYRIGEPDSNSEVLVTANYKLTFDKLRKELLGLNLWILVIDTRGINVWCAAGKGTFGTGEIIKKIGQTELRNRVKHRRIILPQLAAPGVASHMITRATGFRVIYGPVRAEDIPRFIKNNYIADEEMRKVKFDFMDRLALTPMEMVLSIKYIPFIFIFIFILNIFRVGSINSLFKISIINLIPYIYAIFAGTFLFPVLLPIIPGRAFSIKGTFMGLCVSGLFIKFHEAYLYPGSLLNIIGNSILIICICSYLGLNFTGSTTYTSFSGTQKETLWSLPIMLLAVLIGLILIITSIFIS